MKKIEFKSVAAVVLCGGLLSLTSCSESEPPKAERAAAASFEHGVPGGIAVDTTTVTANVVSVFGATRELVLDYPDGKRETIVCGPEVVNFDQIRAGDQVKATVTEEIAVAMAAENDPLEAGAVSAVALSPKGAQPGGVMVSVKQVTATVTAIDVANHTATLQFPGGTERKFPVRSDVDLTKRKVGEKVVIRKTDAMALRVEKVQAPK